MHGQPLSFISQTALADPEKHYDVYVV